MSTHFEGGETHKLASNYEKLRLVELSFECTKAKAESYNSLSKKYQFNNLVQDVTFQLWRWFPEGLRQEVDSMLDELDGQVEKIKNSQLTEQKKQKEIIETEFEYYRKLHNINNVALPYSTVFEIDVTGELDITDEKAIAVIRHKIPCDLPAKYRG